MAGKTENIVIEVPNEVRLELKKLEDDADNILNAMCRNNPFVAGDKSGDHRKDLINNNRNYAVAEVFRLLATKAPKFQVLRHIFDAQNYQANLATTWAQGGRG